MTAVARYYTWMPVTSGMRTRIWQGPLLHVAPVQWLVFGRFGPQRPVNFFVTVYSAAAPWYLTASGMGTVWPLSRGPIGDISTGAPPWDTGFPLWLLASPWTEVFVVTDMNCMAQLDVI